MGLQEAVPESLSFCITWGLLETNTFYWVLQYLNSRDLKDSVFKRDTQLPRKLLRPAGWGLRVPFSPLGTGCLDTLRGVWT